MFEEPVLEEASDIASVIIYFYFGFVLFYICCMLQSLVHCLDRYCWNVLELHYFKLWLDGKIVHWFPMNWKILLSASFAHQFLLSLFSPGYNQFSLVPSFFIVLQCLLFIVTFSDNHRIDFGGYSFSPCSYDLLPVTCQILFFSEIYMPLSPVDWQWESNVFC